VAYTGAWKRATQTTHDPALHNALDPAHNDPQDEEQIFWADTSGDIVPGMPADVEGDQYNVGTPPSDGAYLDMTPQGGDFGMGAFPGMTIAEGQAIRGVAHSQDFGSVDARKYVPPPNRGHLEIQMVETPEYEGNPAEQNNIRWVTGVGGPYDGGNSVHGKRKPRWLDRVIPYHWYDVEMNPSYQRYATPAVTKPVVTANRNQAMSPFAAGQILYEGGSFTVPQERRTPEPWDTGLIESGTPEPGADFGLGTWGL
jgi:hypothetical protein